MAPPSSAPGDAAAALFVVLPRADGVGIVAYRLLPAYQTPGRFIDRAPKGLLAHVPSPSTGFLAVVRGGQVVMLASLGAAGAVEDLEVKEKEPRANSPQDSTAPSTSCAVVDLSIWPSQQRAVVKLYTGIGKAWSSTSSFYLEEVNCDEFANSAGFTSQLFSSQYTLDGDTMKNTFDGEYVVKLIGRIEDIKALSSTALEITIGRDIVLTPGLLGKGSCGSVQKCCILGNQGALKVMFCSEAARSGSEPCEIRILSNLHHPSILRFFFARKDATKTYICTELCKRTLIAYLNSEEEKSSKDLERVFGEIVRGLHYLHGIGVVHRSLKPENIMLDHKNGVKIIDFGQATNLPENGNSLKGGSFGTYMYRAPELRLTCDHDSKVDIFSLGIILYEIGLSKEVRQRKTRRGSLRSIRNKIFYSTNWRTLLDKKMAWDHYKFARGWLGDIDLLLKMLTLRSCDRPSITDVVNHMVEASEKGQTGMDKNSAEREDVETKT